MLFPKLASEVALDLPVFPIAGIDLKVGDDWSVNGPPSVLSASLFQRVLKGEIEVRSLPPTVITGKWRGWKDVAGYNCAVLDLTFAVNLAPEHRRGAEDGSIAFSATCYFAVEQGIPVVTFLESEGFQTNDNGNRVDLAMRGKVMLIDYEK